LLKYADKAENDPYWTGVAYQKYDCLLVYLVDIAGHSRQRSTTPTLPIRTKMMFVYSSF
jgi:hypothetical protein